MMRKIAITTGDPAGIGPEITSKAIKFYSLEPNIVWIVYGRLLHQSDGNIAKKIKKAAEAVDFNRFYWIEIDDKSIKPGQPSKNSGKIAYQILERCMKDISNEEIDAVVTCPVSKFEIRKTQSNFIGHTEFFSHKSNCQQVAMSFWGAYFNISLLTTHLPLQEVSQNLQKENLEQKLRFIYRETEKIKPGSKYALLGLNPHAGEAGAFGKEEFLFQEVLQKLVSQNIKIDGPFAADTFFKSKVKKYDMIISAYHDQGLIPFKQITGNKGVNVTLGLPFLRTSVDHGTAFDIAGRGIADEKSLEEAMKFAEKHFIQIKENRNYSVFAKYYDKFMEHVAYNSWVKFVLKIFHKYRQKTPRNCLEMACGTANVASRLVRRGIKTDACDKSPEMLKIAAEKEFKPHLFQHDMLQKIRSDKYEMVLLLFDSINYLLQKRQITSLLENVYDSLEKKGLFFFDISTMKNGRKNFNSYVDIKDWQEAYIIHVSEFIPEDRIQKTTLDFFIKNYGIYQYAQESHLQKIYTVKEIADLIQKTKFKFLGIYDAEVYKNQINSNLSKLDASFHRLFFVLQK